jgi:Rho guanine nucleotide exchange factor 4/29
VKVRRANSAKVPNSTVKSLSHKTSDQASSSISTKRSLSQPSDLDAIVTDKMLHNLENIRHIDEADTDTDSITSNHLEDIEDDGHNIVYAEVLYSFEAGGPNELSLEKGTLVQILKRDDGPWWWGRVKLDDIAPAGDETDGQHQGWFPKDFVKLIPNFASTRSKFKNQISYEYDCDNHLASLLPPTSAAPSISSSQSSSEVMRDNVIKELLETEINYVKLLNSLVEG